MAQIHCHLPIKIRVTGRFNDAQLDALMDSLAQTLEARIESAEQTILENGRPEPGTLPGKAPRETADALRRDESAYAVPSYEEDGDLVRLMLETTGEVESFDQLWRTFERHRLHNREQEALNIAPSLVERMSGEDAVRHGVELAQWLMDQNRWELAQDVLDTLERGWWIRFVTENAPNVPSPSSVYSMLGGPEELIDRAKDEAQAGRNEQAFRLFGLAFLFLQMQLSQFYEQRSQELESLRQVPPEAASGVATIGRVFSYHRLRQLYGMMREILGFYPRLEREALAASNPDRARRYSVLGFALNLELEEEYSLPDMQTLTLESSRTTTSQGGTGYTIHGTEGREEVVTPLPGTPSPQEIGDYPVYYSRLENVRQAIAGQEEFITELYRHPEFVAEFGNQPPDMNDLSDRLRVWRTMYRVYQQEDIGFGSLHRLMDLMERYLRFFTRHTVYNVRDLGTNYLTTERPRDLLGRTVRDCGVYALTVAYEVYRTAHSAQPRLPVQLQLYVMPEHVSLVIFDMDQETHYIVNNDRIDGPYRGGPSSQTVMENLAKRYGATMSRPAFVTPTMRTDLGGSGISPSIFRRRTWQRYQIGTSWGFRAQPRRGPDDTRTEAEREEAAYTQYYEDMEQFSQGIRRLDGAINELNLSQVARRSRRLVLGRRLPDLMQLGTGLMQIFLTYGPNVVGRLATNDPRLAGRSPEYLYFMAGREDVAFPLTRLGMALMYYERLGGQLSARQQQYLQALRSVPAFQQSLDRYDQAGRPPTF